MARLIVARLRLGSAPAAAATLRVSQLFTDLTHLFGLFIALVMRTYVLISVIIHR